MLVKKEIIYPIFLECCQYADDTFWENIFEDLAYGKSPYGTYISKDFLCCGYKKKEFSYKIEKKNTEVIYSEIYELLTKKLGLLSYREKIKKKKIFTDLENSFLGTRKKWSDIKKKNMKELLIELYVTRMKNKYLLSSKQAKYLISIILIALVFKVITSNSIDYNNGRINSIEGIDFAKKQVIIKSNLYSLEVNFAPHIFVDKKTMSENWEKFLENLRKISEK
jgi:hypothetical protein